MEKRAEENSGRFFDTISKILICAAAILFFSTVANAATYTVVSGADSGAGTLREAIDAGTADIIEISPSVKEITLSSIQITIIRNVTINGNGASVRGGGVSRLFAVSKGQVKFSRLTFIGGGNSNSAPENGGAAYIDSSAADVTFENCVFFENIGQDGGAVHVYGSGAHGVRFINCTLTNNRALGGGGGVSVFGGNVRFDASIITGNSASSAADVYHSETGTVSNSGQYNVVGATNAASFSAAQNNDTGVSPDDVFLTPGVLSVYEGAQIAELLNSSRNKALDKIPPNAALAFSLPATDIRGANRPQMKGIDAGAVELLPVALVNIDIAGSENLEIGARLTYSATVSPEKATLNVFDYPNGDGLVWSVDAPYILSIDQQGNAIALSVGEVLLTVEAHGWDTNGNSIVKTASKRVKVRTEATVKPTVKVRVNGIDTGTDVKMTTGSHANINATVIIEPEGTPYDLRFTSSLPTIATVDELAASENIHSARVAARSIGETIIRVTVDAENSKGKAEQSSTYYFLTVTKKSSRGGGGCSVASSFLVFLPLVILTVRAKKRK
ncbi:hypothetical protein AGMMS50276_11450 [Synergistales bacterium]|nr:hypothetical protein AGMMS50276_11450 [Synergistales bacterium]